MNSESSLSRYILVILAVSVVFTTIVLVALNAWVGNKGSVPVLNNLSGKSYEDGYRDGFNAAKELQKTNPTALLDRQFAMSGFIVSVGTDRLVVRDADTSEEMTVYIASTTTITKRTSLTDEQLQEKMRLWEASSALTPPPLAVEESEASVSDFLAGQNVIVDSATNISDLDYFTASTITVNGD